MEELYSGKTIIHNGIVQKFENESVTVTISAESACVGCHVKGSCSLSEKKDKTIDIIGHYDVKEGDAVSVMMKQSAGFSALFLGYLLPLIVVLVCMIIFSVMEYPELITGLAAISSLLPYYLILYILRKRIDNKFIFSLKV